MLSSCCSIYKGRTVLTWRIKYIKHPRIKNLIIRDFKHKKIWITSIFMFLFRFPFVARVECRSLCLEVNEETKKVAEVYYLKRFRHRTDLKRIQELQNKYGRQERNIWNHLTNFKVFCLLMATTYLGQEEGGKVYTCIL